MHHFQYRNNELHCEDVPVSRIAKDLGTPFYLYSYATLRQHFRAFDGAFDDVPHLTCFAMKSNSNLAILKLFALEGGGVDIVSGGELYRALKAGIDPKVLEVVRTGGSLKGLDDADAAVIQFGRELIGKRNMSSDTFAKVAKLYGNKGAMDMVAVMSTYAVSGFFAIAVDEHPPADKPTLPPLKL